MVFTAIAKKVITLNYFPLKFEGTAMKPNVLLICKLMFLLLVVHGFYNFINDPYIPFVPFLDIFNNYPGVFKIVLRTLFVVAGGLLLVNYYVKLMSFILGLVVCLALLSSIPKFANHYFICGCVFLLASFTDKSQYPLLLVAQLCLIYFGASLNKVLQIDWWNGRFMYNWLAIAREDQLFISVSQMFPDLWLAKVLSWGTMFLELFIAFLLMLKKRHNLAVWLIIFFHTILYSFTILRFGHFYEDILILLLIFLDWPKEKMEVLFYESKSVVLKNILYILHFNQNISVVKDDSLTNDKWLKVTLENRHIVNWKGIKFFLLYNPNFYLALFFMDLLIRFLFNGVIMHITYMIMFWGVILGFLLMTLKRKASSIV